MESKGAIGIESERFSATNYLIKDGHIIVATANNGKLSIDMKKVKPFCEELLEITEEWSDY